MGHKTLRQGCPERSVQNKDHTNIYLFSNMSKLGVFTTLLIISIVKEGVTARRQQRLFFVTTETSTISTSTLCWSPPNGVNYNQITGGDCKRRRRSVYDQIDSEGIAEAEIDPSQALDSSMDVEDDLVQEQERQARQNNALNFLLYWATSTVLTTSYTKYGTLTIGNPDYCTPSGMPKCSDV